MQLGPVLLLLLILFVLSISVIFGNYLQYLYVTPTNKFEEGLITFHSDATDQQEVRILQYSTERSVRKLYDNLYYDNVNGTVLVLDGEQSASSESDISGNTLTSMKLWNRNGYEIPTKQITDPKVPTGKNEHAQSKVSNLVNSYKPFKIIYDNDSDKYELIYIPWKYETFIHIIQLKSNSQDVAKHLRTYAYDSSGKIMKSNESNGVIYNNNNNSITQTYTLNKKHQNDNNSMILNKYATNTYIYQLCSNVMYDKNNGNIVSVDENNIRVYPRITLNNVPDNVLTSAYTNIQPDIKITLPKTVENVEGFSAGVLDTYNNTFTVLYISSGKRTILVSLVSTSSDNSKREFDIHNVVRFDAIGRIDTGKGLSEIRGSIFDTKVDDSNGSIFDPNDYYKLLMYLQGSPDGNLYQLPITNDYMLKSQVVPPVCPTCPSCPSNSGVCTNCGGNGGSGTKNTNNTPIANLLEDTGSGTVRLVRDTGSGAVSLVRDAASGTVGLAKDTASGTVGLAKDVVGGTINLAKDAGKGIADTVSSLNRPVSLNSLNSNVNSANSPIYAGSDPTSYYGAIPSKGGNYIPVTADFSRFGR